MTQVPTQNELQDFALNFENNIVRPLVLAGYDKYNVFDILNINRQELRHSDFLAFLFDPSKSGVIGLQFLRNFLVLLAKEIVPQLDFFNMLYGNIEKVNVSREVAVHNGRIDILIDLEITKDETQKIVIAIENKVDTGEHDNQLGKYKEYLSDETYKNHQKVMLYLSPDKTPPSDNAWIAIDYGFISSVLNRIDLENVDNTLKTLVIDYKKILRSEFGMTNDDELKQKAIEIYKKNRKVLDFIYDSKPDWKKEASNIIHDFLTAKGFKVLSKSPNINVLFRTQELASYKNYYLQICIDEMSLLFINDSGKRVTKKQWLFGDSQKSAEAVKRYEELVFDTVQLKADCTQMLKQAFEKDGVIAYCLAALKN